MPIYQPTEAYSGYGDVVPYLYSAGQPLLRLNRGMQGDPAGQPAEEKAAERANAATVAAVSRMNNANDAARIAAGIPPAGAMTRFIDVKGGRVLRAPITANTQFPLVTRVFHLMEAFNNGPFPSTTKVQTPTAGVATVNFAPADFRPGGPSPVLVKVPLIIIQVAPSKLTAIPNATVQINITAEDLDGNALTLSQLDVLYEDSDRTQLIITLTPWRLVDDKAVPSLARVVATSAPFDLSITASGLQNDAQMTVVIPGANHALVAETLSMIRW